MKNEKHKKQINKSNFHLEYNNIAILLWQCCWVID